MATCDLYDIWSKACQTYDLPEDSIRSWYERIRTKLSEDDDTKRVYHNWSMLAHKRPELERAKPHIVLAAFFQYYAFDLEKNCVQENCEIFKEFCRDAMVEDNDMKQSVCHLLGERSTEAISSDVEDDMAKLQDLDLLILASSPDVYKNYAELSRQEWLNSGKTNYDDLRRKLTRDDVPSTSRKAINRSPTKKSKRSPLKAGYVKKFQKIRDDKAKQLIKRSRLMIRDIQIGKANEGNRSYLNKSMRKKLKSPKFKGRNNKRSVVRKSKTNASNTSSKSLQQNEGETGSADSDDDCIIVENTATRITIVDDGDSSDDEEDDMHSTTIGYNSLFQSFPNGLSSTPCVKNTKSMTPSTRALCTTANANNMNYNAAWQNQYLHQNHQYPPSYNNFVSYQANAVSRNPVHGSAPFFVDVGKKTFLGNVNYNTVAPLREKSPHDDDEVVIVDKTNDEKSTLTESSDSESSEEESEEDVEEVKGCESNAVDDSVIFISKTNSNDFIPINGTVDGNLKAAPRPEAPVAQKRPHLYSELFTRNEKKQLENYNSNAYNPHAGEVFTSKKRMVIIDGSNVAFKHSLDKEFSVHGLKIAIEYFERMGHEVKAVIPQFRMNNHKSSDPAEMEKLHKSGKIVQTPCKNLPGLTSSSYDDRFILQLSSELDAVIVSNDNYRDLLHENPAFKKIIETRVIGYTWCNDIFILPKDPYGRWGPTLDKILNRS